MTTLREASQQALEALQTVFMPFHPAVIDLKAALEQPERALTDEVIAELWHANGGFYHHFARAVERWAKGQG